MIQAQVFQRLLADFPCMSPCDPKFRHFHGFITISQREFRVSISADCTFFSTDKSLKSILSPCFQQVRDRLQISSDAHEFLLELRDLAERQINALQREKRSLEVGLPPAHYYEQLLTDLSRIGWGRVVSMNETMRTLDLTTRDATDRIHNLNLTLPTDYPKHPPKCLTSLPVEFELEWGRDSTLVSVLRQFEKRLAQYQDFFRTMEDLDNHSWILEPEYPTTREIYRRVALGKTCSMRVEVDPRAPLKGFPEIRFLGSETAIEPYKERLNQNIQLWDISGQSLLRQNLERVLEVTLPLPVDENDKDSNSNMVECGICYAYRLEESTPDITCDLAECSKPYHRACLVEWLRALPVTRESFGMITGNCVYCEEIISVSVAVD